MTFCGKLEDGSEQTRRLPQLGPKFEVNRILGEVVSPESEKSPERVRAVLNELKNSHNDRDCGGSWKQVDVGLLNSTRMKAWRKMTDDGDDVMASSENGGVRHLQKKGEGYVTASSKSGGVGHLEKVKKTSRQAAGLVASTILTKWRR